jgi:hypothetical protein
LPVARIVHLRLPSDVSQFRLFGDGRIQSATTETLPSSPDAGDGDFVMPFQKANVTTRYHLARRVGSVGDGHGPATAALALTGGIRAARVVRFDGVPAGLPFRSVAP